MKLVVTIFEPSAEGAIEAIRGLRQPHDMVELRVDAFEPPVILSRADGEGSPNGKSAVFRDPSPSSRLRMTLDSVRAATAKPVIVTNRGGAPVDFDAAYSAGIDFVDVEFGRDPGPCRDRVILSHHDYEGMPDVERLLRDMQAEGCAHAKLAVTPKTFHDNARLLANVTPSVSEGPGGAGGAAGSAPRAAPPPRPLARARGDRITLIGMGERGLYSRIAAPFFGSELQFVAVDDGHVAAPGQLTLADARAIYGDDPRAGKLFAVAGNPAGHSRSPLIHNPIFREKGVGAAYTIASFETFGEIAEAFAKKEPFAPLGMSVTAPFKEEALAFAQRINADIAPNARDAGAVNTLAWIGNRIVADNTDVDGFEALIQGTKAALVGAGGTARAARVALARRGIPFTIYNRTPREGARPLEELKDFDGDLIVDTLPLEIELPSVPKTIRAAYKQTANDLLRAQAVRQSAIFLLACHPERSEGSPAEGDSSLRSE